MQVVRRLFLVNLFTVLLSNHGQNIYFAEPKQSCLSFCSFSFGHCIVCLSSSYGFW